MTSNSDFAKQIGTAVRSSSGSKLQFETAAPIPSESSKQNAIAPNPKRWATSGPMYWGAPETVEALPAAFYRVHMTQDMGPVLHKQDLHTDNLLELPDAATTAIIREFATFWQVGDKFREYGFLHKRGFMLWGPPGSGKTSCLQLLIKKLVTDHSGIVVAIDEPHSAGAALQIARRIEPDRPMICVLEDFDALVERHGENQFLAILDGEAQVNNVCFVATTNYPERLDKRFVDRPSRFDTIMYIGMPSAAAREAYFSAKDPALKDSPDEMAQWVRKSMGFSLAHLKEMIVAVRCFGQSLDDVVSRLEEMHERQPTSEDTPERQGAGFLNGRAH